MNLYSIDIKICATAYIKAKSEAEALAKLKAHYGEGDGAELPIGETEHLTVSGRTFLDPRLPEISISPAITFHGTWPHAEFNFVEEGLP